MRGKVYHAGDKRTTWVTYDAGEHKLTNGWLTLECRHKVKCTETLSANGEWRESTLLLDSWTPDPTHWERFTSWLRRKPLPRATVVKS